MSGSTTLFLVAFGREAAGTAGRAVGRLRGGTSVSRGR